MMQPSQTSFETAGAPNFEQAMSISHNPNEYNFLHRLENPTNFSMSLPKTYASSLIGMPSSSTSSNSSSPFANSCPESIDKLTADKKEVNKYSEDYKQKREKNNIAVRKSREKAKRRLKLNELRINELISENQKLKNRIEVMNRVVNGLKALLTTFGYSHSKIDYEINKTLSQQPWSPSESLGFGSLADHIIVD